MKVDTVTYILPLHEQTRVLLRLEYLYADLRRHLEPADYDSIFLALKALDEILTVLELNNIKQYLLAEINDISAKLIKWRRHSVASSERIDNLLSDLNAAKTTMENTSSMPGDMVRINDFIKVFRHKSNIAGGMSIADFPRFHYWMRQNFSSVVAKLSTWYVEVEEIGEIISLVLDFLRQSISRKEEVAENGFFQVSLNKDVEYKFIEVSLPADSPCFAEISGGRYHITVRMVHESHKESIEQYRENVPFILGACAIG